MTHSTCAAHTMDTSADMCQHSRSDWFEGLPEAVCLLETVPLAFSSVCGRVCVYVLWEGVCV